MGERNVSRSTARAAYDGISIYSPKIESWRIDLSDNTNLWGTPPSALRALKALGGNAIARYPQPYSTDLRSLLAEYAGVQPEMIVVGCGSDDIIDCAMRAFAEPGDTVCAMDPTFSMVPVFAKMNGLRSVAVPVGLDGVIDAGQVSAVKAAVTYICTPNNPTGVALPFSVASTIVDGAEGIVVIDGAYAEFGGETMTPLAASGKAIVTRTMSKAFGLAGLRVGYGIASPEIVLAVEKARGPYKVSVAAEAAAAAALTGDIAWVKERASDAVRNRDRFSSELRALGYAPLESSANFVLVPVRDCGKTAEQLRAAGIAVRGFPGLTGIGDAVRITIGPWQLMRECLDALGAAA